MGHVYQTYDAYTIRAVYLLWPIVESRLTRKHPSDLESTLFVLTVSSIDQPNFTRAKYEDRYAFKCAQNFLDIGKDTITM